MQTVIVVFICIAWWAAIWIATPNRWGSKWKAKNNHVKGRDELLREYWLAHAQFGPFDVGPEEYLRQHATDRD